MPIWPGPGVPAPCPGLRRPASPRHSLWEHHNGGKIGWGGREGWQKQRCLPDLLLAGEVSIRCGTVRGWWRCLKYVLITWNLWQLLSFFCTFNFPLDLISVWSFWSKQTDYLRLPFWLVPTCPVRCLVSSNYGERIWQRSTRRYVLF